MRTARRNPLEAAQEAGQGQGPLALVEDPVGPVQARGIVHVEDATFVLGEAEDASRLGNLGLGQPGEGLPGMEIGLPDWGPGAGWP